MLHFSYFGVLFWIIQYVIKQDVDNYEKKMIDCGNVLCMCVYRHVFLSVQIHVPGEHVGDLGAVNHQIIVLLICHSVL